jgi:dTDP-4-dehydrorhamnose reductase
MDEPDAATRERPPRRLLVVGGSGYLGRALMARAGSEWDATGTCHSQASAGPQLDVRDRGAVDRLLAELRPAVVVNTAYLQSGDEMESVNVAGAGHVAAAATAAGARLIHLSTDVVFDGSLERGGYRESDPPAPVTAYGTSKLAGERVVAAVAPAALIVRTSLIYGGDRPGPHEQLVLDAIDGRSEVAFFSDELRCPVTAGDLAAALLELAGGDSAGPLHVAGADAVSRLEFARLIALAHGRDPSRLRASRSADAGLRRPLNCTLDCGRAAALLGAPLRGVRAALAPGAAVTGHSLD